VNLGASYATPVSWPGAAPALFRPVIA